MNAVALIALLLASFNGFAQARPSRLADCSLVIGSTPGGPFGKMGIANFAAATTDCAVTIEGDITQYTPNQSYTVTVTTRPDLDVAIGATGATFSAGGAGQVASLPNCRYQDPAQAVTTFTLVAPASGKVVISAICGRYTGGVMQSAAKLTLTSSAPTTAPSKTPTNPTTKIPTKNPTRKPTSSFFTSAVSVQSFDLYLLIDTTRGYELINNYCATYRLMSGALATSCLDLLVEYATEIVKSISSSIGYYTNDKTKGLRVQASLIQCFGSQKDPAEVPIFALTGDSTVIMNGLNNARTNTALTDIGSCPIRGFYSTIQAIEDNWIDADDRPYRAVITFTDGQLIDASGTTGTAVTNAVSAVRFRCTPSLVVIPYKITQSLSQPASLKILTGNIAANVFEAKDAPWIVIPKIGEQITTLLSTTVVGNTKCTSESSFSTSDKFWCGFNHPIVCTPRTSCQWSAVVPKGCSKIAAQSGCNFADETSCKGNTNCQWNASTSKCSRKPEEPDCNAYFTQAMCSTKSAFCTWSGTACTTVNNSNHSGGLGGSGGSGGSAGGSPGAGGGSQTPGR